MCYPDRDDYITLWFRLLDEFEASTESNPSPQRGHPKVHSDRSLILFFAIMTLKNVNRFKTQHKWLVANPHWVATLKFKTIPSRVTLSRRYKQLAAKIEAFVAYIGKAFTDHQ